MLRVKKISLLSWVFPKGNTHPLIRRMPATMMLSPYYNTALFCSLLFTYIEHYFLGFFGWNGGGSFWMTAKMIYDLSVSVDFADKESFTRRFIKTETMGWRFWIFLSASLLSTYLMEVGAESWLLLRTIQFEMGICSIKLL